MPPTPVSRPAPRRADRRLAAAALIVSLLVAWGVTSFGSPIAGAQAAGGAPTAQSPTAESPTADPVPDDQPDPEAARAQMTAWKAAVLGVVEGVTEYLPVSSTGHLLVTQRILGIGDTDATKDAADSYAIAIQFGAILAVLLLYWRRVRSILLGLVGRDADGRALLVSLVVAFVPAVIVGVLFEGPIKDRLFGPWPVVIAWIVGGLVVLWVAPRIAPDRPGLSITQIGPRQAIVIGVAQVLAMWPGTSRSLVTLLAALAVGTTLAAAVEFSFLLGLMTLGAATLYETAKNGSDVVDAYGWVDPLVGLVAAFVAAVVAVRWMVAWLQTRSLAVFGWERITAGVVTIALILASVV